MTTNAPKPEHKVGPRARGSKQANKARNFQGFSSETARACRIANLNDAELLDSCAGAYNHINAHFWVEARPFFVELWRRIEEKRIPRVPTKKEACRLIGCSPRWAQAIVAGKARKGTKNKANGSATLSGGNHWKLEPRTDREYVADIRMYAEKKLKPLWLRGESGRSRNIYSLLSQHFADVAKINHIDDWDSDPGKEAAA